MPRIHRLMDFWNRLPVFRVVAETEHLPTASQRLGLTAPALSRSIKLLEESVGTQLFDRRGRRIELNASGQAFLGVVRTAMRQVDDALSALQETGRSGPVTLSSTGQFTPLAIASVLRLRQVHPGLVPTLTHLFDARVNGALLRGELDVALLQFPEAHPELRIEPLASCPYGVYCGPGHPLWGRDDVEVAELLSHPFVAPPAAGFGLPADGWPAHLEREVAVRIMQVEVAARFCASGELLSVLPTPVVLSSPFVDSLHRIPLDLIEPATLNAVYREPVGAPGTSLAEAVVAAVTAELPGSYFPPAPGGSPSPASAGANEEEAGGGR
jgi:DNA-binding transcriptional LysR family regulator